MRTTLDIADDVLFAAKDVARREKKAVGQIVSEFMRRALSSPVTADAGGSANQTASDGLTTVFGKWGFAPCHRVAEL